MYTTADSEQTLRSAASVEPNDGAVFRDEATPILFIAVGFCQRAERARQGGAGNTATIDLTLEPGGRKFQWNLAHGVDEYGVGMDLVQ